MIEKREAWLVALAGLLAVNVAIGFHFYAAGKREVVLKATNDSLVTVRKEKAVIQKQRDSVGAELKIASAKSEKTRTVYVDSRPTIKGDSAFDKTGQFIQVLDPRITASIVDAADHIASLESELKTAKFALRVDTVFIAKQDTETHLNERIADMVKGPRCSRTCGIVIGVSGTIAAAYVAGLFRR